LKQLLTHRAQLARDAAAAIGGIVLSLAFPKASVAGFAWIAPAIILFSAAGTPGKSAFRCWFIGGAAFWLVSLSWLLAIPYTFHGIPLAPALGLVALAAYCSLYMGAWVWFCWRIQPPAPPPVEQTPEAMADRLLDTPALARAAWALKCAMAWVALELLRGWFLSGFPLDFLGASQYRMLPLIQIASVTGVYGVSFLIVWTSVSFGMLALKVWRHPGSRETIWATAGIPLIVVIVLTAIGMSQTATLPPPAPRELKIALVQPSFPQTLIWDPQGDERRFNEVLEMSRQALAAEPDLLIWPESAAPDLSPENQESIARLLAPHKSWLVLCVDSEERRPDGDFAVYNSAVMLDPKGRGRGIYHKRRLVMFGEYIPLIRWLPFLKFLAPIGSGFTPGQVASQFSMTDPAAQMSVLICFEDIFPRDAREHVQHDTDFLINLTNDGWFGNGAAQWQQMASAVFRAVENGLPLVRCSNNGITCWIDAHGRQRTVFGADSNVYTAGIMTARIPLEGGPGRRPTFYNQYGDVFALGCALVSIGLLFARRFGGTCPEI